MKLGLSLAIALSGFACVGGESLATLLGCYVVAIGIVSLPLVQRGIAAAQRAWLGGVIVLVAAPGVSWTARHAEALLDDDGLLGISAQIGDRLRLERMPAIAPPLVAADRPQRFYVSAEGARNVSVRFGTKARALSAQSLGHGLFRVDYDPRRDGGLEPANGPLLATIVVDGAASERVLIAATPLAHPRWLALSPDATLAATVSTETDELLVVSRDGVVARLVVGDGPIACVFVGPREVAISARDAEDVDVFSIDDARRVRSFRVGPRQGRMARSPSGNLLAVSIAGTAPAIALIELASGRVRARVALEHAADWVVFGASDDTLIYSSREDAALHRLQRTSADAAFTATSELRMGRPAVTLARIAGGTQLVAATTDYSEGGAPQLGNHFVQDQLLFVDSATLRVIGQERTARRSARQSTPGDVDRGLSPLGIAQGPNAELLVAFAGSDELVSAYGASNSIVVRDLGESGLYAPHGVAALADGTLVVSSPVAGAIGLFAAGARKPRLLKIAPDDAALYARDRAALERRVGERGFYEGTKSGISCQSCHMHADSDEAAYNLGDRRLIPTLSVRGLARTAPYLRDGSYPRLRDLHDVARTLYRGYLRSQGARGEALEAFMSALPRREPRVAFTLLELSRERRGFDVFVRAGCPRCHTPPAFTNLGMLPMAALFPDEARRLLQPEPEMLDTPSLLSVGASAPYLNDARAKTLYDVIGKHNPKNLHGDTRTLTTRERADLIAFLESL